MVKGNHHCLTTRQLDAIFKFPTKLGILQNFNKDELLDLWLTIAGPSPYTSARSKSYAIRSHVLRYLHLCIANTFFPTKTTSHINENELGMLDLSMCFILGYTKSGLEMVGDRWDTSFFVVFIDHLMSYREYASQIAEPTLSQLVLWTSWFWMQSQTARSYTRATCSTGQPSTTPPLQPMNLNTLRTVWTSLSRISLSKTQGITPFHCLYYCFSFIFALCGYFLLKSLSNFYYTRDCVI